MFILLEGKQDIAAAERTLEATFKREFSRRETKYIGYPGGSTHDAKVYTDGTYWYWPGGKYDKNTPNPRLLNWFGLFNEETGLNITVEINVALEGRNDQAGGFFARDSNTGRIYLMHSGRVGGGTKGVSKEKFLAWSNAELHEAIDLTGKPREGIIAMPIDALGATQPCVQYIRKIAEFKIAVREGLIDSLKFRATLDKWQEYYAESHGRRKGKRSSEIDYISRHGEVVDALNTWRKSTGLEKGQFIVKNNLIDLGVKTGAELTEIYEVKSSASRQSVYTAIGQVFVHGTSDNCQRIIVLPQDESLSEDLKLALKRTRIKLLPYKLDRYKATILPIVE